MSQLGGTTRATPTGRATNRQDGRAARHVLVAHERQHVSRRAAGVSLQARRALAAAGACKDGQIGGKRWAVQRAPRTALSGALACGPCDGSDGRTPRSPASIK